MKYFFSNSIMQNTFDWREAFVLSLNFNGNNMTKESTNYHYLPCRTSKKSQTAALLSLVKYWMNCSIVIEPLYHVQIVKKGFADIDMSYSQYPVKYFKGNLN